MSRSRLVMGTSPEAGRRSGCGKVTSVAPEADKDNWSVRGQRARLEKDIAHVERRLGDEPFLVGPELSLADISVGCALGMWSGGLGLPLPDKIVAWRERLAARSTYRSAFARNQAPSCSLTRAERRGKTFG